MAWIRSVAAMLLTVTLLCSTSQVEDSSEAKVQGAIESLHEALRPGMTKAEVENVLREKRYHYGYYPIQSIRDMALAGEHPIAGSEEVLGRFDAISPALSKAAFTQTHITVTAYIDKRQRLISVQTGTVIGK